MRVIMVYKPTYNWGAHPVVYLWYSLVLFAMYAKSVWTEAGRVDKLIRMV